MVAVTRLTDGEHGASKADGYAPLLHHLFGQFGYIDDRVGLTDDLFDCLVFELGGIFRTLHLQFSITVLTSSLSTDLRGMPCKLPESRQKKARSGDRAFSL